jgi:hypothetical protein
MVVPMPDETEEGAVTDSSMSIIFSSSLKEFSTIEKRKHSKKSKNRFSKVFTFFVNWRGGKR